MRYSFNLAGPLSEISTTSCVNDQEAIGLRPRAELQSRGPSVFLRSSRASGRNADTNTGTSGWFCRDVFQRLPGAPPSTPLLDNGISAIVTASRLLASINRFNALKSFAWSIGLGMSSPEASVEGSCSLE